MISFVNVINFQGPICLRVAIKTTSYFYQSVNVNNFGVAKSDHIKRHILYCYIAYKNNTLSMRKKSISFLRLFLKEGELCVAGPQVMKGYLNDEESTRFDFLFLLLVTSPNIWGLFNGKFAHYCLQNWSKMFILKSKDIF